MESEKRGSASVTDRDVAAMTITRRLRQEPCMLWDERERVCCAEACSDDVYVRDMSSSARQRMECLAIDDR